MSKKRVAIVVLGVAGAISVALGLLFVGKSARNSATGGEGKPSTSLLSGFLAPYQGQVLVLLLGREGCPGTAKATTVLEAFARNHPTNVSVLRLDVPLPKEKLRLAGAWSYSFPRRLDEERRIASQLDFFYYPTLYVFDPEGEMRFTGGCDGARVETMVRELLAEKPGQPKKSYTLPMPAVGAAAPAFAAANLAGTPVSLNTLRGRRGTLLVFARTSCPFTVEALPAIKSIGEAYRQDGVEVVIINNGEEPDQLRKVYGKGVPGLPVVWDQNGEVSKAYGIDVTPFHFLLDKDGKIAARRSFTPAAATGSLNALLGRGKETPRFKATEAG